MPLKVLKGVSTNPKSKLNLASSETTFGDTQNEYVKLQQRIFKLTIVVSAFAALIAAVFVNSQASISLLVGAFAGILYLRLLARSIGKLGEGSASVSKFQLLVPVVLVLAITKLPQLDLIPSLVGFLLYKPSLIIQFLLKP